MSVNDDADLLWQILVREIYVLMNHYKTKEELQLAFKKIEVAKNKPKQEALSKTSSTKKKTVRDYFSIEPVSAPA